MRTLTLLQAATAAAVGGSLLAVAVPAFLRNFHASRTAEPLEGLAHLAARAAAGAEGRPLEASFPDSAPLTPAVVPAGTTVIDAPGTWEHSTWRSLGFSLNHAHAYSFGFDSRQGPDRALFHAWAEGDLDGDGVRSRFWVDGTRGADGVVVVSPLGMEREVE